MNTKQKKEALKNALITYKFPKKFFIKSDEIKGNRFAIATEEGERGAIQVHTNYMDYDQFNAWFFGFIAGKENRLNF